MFSVKYINPFMHTVAREWQPVLINVASYSTALLLYLCHTTYMVKVGKDNSKAFSGRKLTTADLNIAQIMCLLESTAVISLWSSLNASCHFGKNLFSQCLANQIEKCGKAMDVKWENNFKKTMLFWW